MIQSDFTINPLSGFILATDFVFQTKLTNPNIKQYIWDFGDEQTTYDVSTTNHVYKTPGTYNITLSTIDITGEISTTTKKVDVTVVYSDYVKFSQIPEKFSDPGKITDTPFKIEIISSNPNQPLFVDLFATNSNSAPYEFIPEKWNFLTPTWKFLDKDLNVVTSLSVESVPLFFNNRIAGVSGTAEFYYIDSQSVFNPVKNCPILITATLQTSGFKNYKDSYIYSYDSHSNSQTARAGVVWQVNEQLPTLLKVTSNYIDSINPYQWKDIKIPTLITAHSNRNSLIPGSSNSISEVLFSYPATNTSGNVFPLNLTLSASLSTTSFNYDSDIEDEPLFFKAQDKDLFNSSGYIFTTLTPLETALSASIFAETTAFNSFYENLDDKTFIFPYGLSPNPSVWISNPARSSLNKVTLVPDPGNCTTINYFRDNNVLTDGIIKEVTVPSIDDDQTTFNYFLCGFAGIFGMAIDPRNYDLIACDAELDCIYRIKHTGEILSRYDLTNLGDYDPFNRIFSHWTFTTPVNPSQGDSYNFYNPTFLSNNSKNYIVQIGGLVQPPNTYSVNPNTRTLNIPIINDVPPGNVRIDVFQVFNPSLTAYVESLTSWVTSSPTNNTSFYLTGNPILTLDPNYYIVSVEGLVQPPSTYTIDPLNYTITFSETISANYTVQILHIPTLTTPNTWTFSVTNSQTNRLQLPDSPNYVFDSRSSFVLNFGGILQPPDILFGFDSIDRTLTFKNPLPTDIPIHITQLSIPDTIYQPAAYTPAYVSLDKNYNMWVSLVNSVSVIKFDQNFVPVHITTPNGFPFIEQTYENEYLLRPPVVETDRFNSCWATYANPLCSLLVKYSDQGEVQTQITLPQFSIPIGLAINSNNDIWVANTYNSSYEYFPYKGLLQLYSGTTYQLLSTVVNVERPNYLAVDRNNNLWYGFGLQKIGYINSQTGTVSAWTLINESSGSGINFDNSFDGIKIISTSLPGDIYTLLLSGESLSGFEISPAELIEYTITTFTSGTTFLLSGFELPYPENNEITYVYDVNVNSILLPTDEYIFSVYEEPVVFADPLAGSGQNTIIGRQITLTTPITSDSTIYIRVSAFLKSITEDLELDENLGGLAIDVYDRVWIIDSSNNNVWVLSATPQFTDAPIRKFKIIPDASIGYYIDPITGKTFTESKENLSFDVVGANTDFIIPEVRERYLYKSAQATGDWTGNKWYQKYIFPSELSAISITGASNPFKIDEFTHKYQIKKINESFNNSKYLNDLALPENLKSNTTLFQKFFAASIGTGAGVDNNDLGQTIYEKIGNFSINHADIDTCNIDQVASLAQLVDVQSIKYAARFPADIQRMINIASVSKSKLWGIKDNTYLLPQSLGNSLNTQNYILTAGTEIALKSKLDNSINVISVPVQNTSLTYPLSEFLGYGFIQPVTTNYIFYELSPVYNNQYIENIIDWNSEDTRLSPTLSTANDWFGDNGIVETSFRYLLTKNLFLNNIE